MALTLLGLHYFRAVADAGSLSAASVMLGVAQSAISRQMRALEEDLGTQLLLRHRQGASLTPAGEHLLEHAADILRQTGVLRSSVAALEPKTRGELRIGFPPSLNQARKHVDAALEILDRLDETLLAALLSDTLDRLNKRMQASA